MTACPSIPPDIGFLRGMLDYIDCQAQSIGAEGYRALAAPGSSLSFLLLGFLTLFVALFGYRLLLGQTPSVRDGILALVKIGIVLALATGWSAYRTLVYDVAFHGPAEIASEIGRPTGLPGSGGGLVVRLDYTDRAMIELAALGTGTDLRRQSTIPSAEPGQPPTPTAAVRQAQAWDPFFMASARVVFLVGSIGALAAVWLAAGLMLALGPFFVAFLLFDSTRGLFEGWLRVLGGAALGAVGSAVVLGTELAMLEPWLAQLIARRLAEEPIIGVPVELFAATLVFALALIAMLVAAARVAYGFRFPTIWREAPSLLASALGARQVGVAAVSREAVVAAADRSRAATIADAVAATQRRESAPAPAGTLVTAAPAATHTARHTTVHDRSAAPPPARLGQSFRRRTTGRVSASSGRRDRAS